MKRLLLVDDETNVLQALRRSLTRSLHGQDVSIETFDDPQLALDRAIETGFDLVISDFRMPQMDGVEFLKAFRHIQPDAVRLILSASTDFDGIMNAVNQAEIHRYLVKPWSDDELAEIVLDLLSKQAVIVEDRRLADEIRFPQEELSAEEIERRRLEAEEPGITKVNWTSDGAVSLSDDEDET